jgi:hypothetical protein
VQSVKSPDLAPAVKETVVLQMVSGNVQQITDRLQCSCAKSGFMADQNPQGTAE